ncbi:hypothetical protein EKO04_000315 [Ascochyta lentis]|uniref:C2H2-type domain-containing protein n=1 Tax=Ascochyta lentis TaxID=205686 RepID=A0A8H7JC66_9PLEO|nr:hypothetical protein EKO04_000315 [Ascochyta lentis]
MASAIPISAAVDDCARAFLSLASSLEKPTRFAEQVDAEEILDEFDRFKLWAGNIAAHRKGRRSLENRLRDAARLKGETHGLLVLLTNALKKALAIADEACIPWDEETYSDSESEHSDDDTSNPDLQGYTELKQLYASIKTAITSLMRISMAIREPAPNSQSRSIDKSHFEQHDIQHVQNKFPSASPYLTERLGHAISSRRQYLTYRETHHEKLTKGIDKLGLEAARTEFTTNSTEATRLERTASFNIMDGNDDDDDTASQASYATSIDATVRAPKLPKEAREREHYDCPFCFALVAIHTTAAWKRHVYQDLHPYCCTFANCTTADKLYDSRHAWFAHELEAHHSSFQCVQGCSKVFRTESEFESHVRSKHEDLAAPAVYSALRRASARTPGLTEETVCKLFDKRMTLCAMQKHLGHHHEQLALFALPANLDDTEDNPDEDDQDSLLRFEEHREEGEDELTDTSDASETEELIQIFDDQYGNLISPENLGRTPQETIPEDYAFEDDIDNQKKRKNNAGSEPDLEEHREHEYGVALDARRRQRLWEEQRSRQEAQDREIAANLMRDENSRAQDRAEQRADKTFAGHARVPDYSTSSGKSKDGGHQASVDSEVFRYSYSEDESDGEDEEEAFEKSRQVHLARVNDVTDDAESQAEPEYRASLQGLAKSESTAEGSERATEEVLDEFNAKEVPTEIFVAEAQTQHGNVASEAAVQQAAADAYNKKKAQEDKEAAEEYDRIIYEYERKKVLDAEKAKIAREELVLQLKLEEEKRKQNDKEEYEAFLLKQMQIADTEKLQQEAENRELEEAMRTRLQEFGFEESQIQTMMQAEKTTAGEKGKAAMSADDHSYLSTPMPTYAKVRAEHLDVETLHYYDIPYEYDTDPNYIIVLREMSAREIDVIFEHTRRLRLNLPVTDAGQGSRQSEESRSKIQSSEKRQRQPGQEELTQVSAYETHGSGAQSPDNQFSDLAAEEVDPSQTLSATEDQAGSTGNKLFTNTKHRASLSSNPTSNNIKADNTRTSKSAVVHDKIDPFRTSRFKVGDRVRMPLIQDGVRVKGLFTIYRTTLNTRGDFEYILTDNPTGQLYRNGATVREMDIKPSWK